jgi:hypothetical protein
MNKYLQDPRFQAALSVGLGMRMQTGADFAKENGMAADEPMSSASPADPEAMEVPPHHTGIRVVASTEAGGTV